MMNGLINQALYCSLSIPRPYPYLTGILLLCVRAFKDSSSLLLDKGEPASCPWASSSLTLHPCVCYCNPCSHC